jgi:hypothetical protein
MFLCFKEVFFKINFFYFKLIFLVFLNYFNVLISKNNLLKNKKYYFNIFSNKKIF